MLKIHELREIIRLLDQSSIQEFDLEDEGTKITIRKGAVSPVAYQVPVVQAAQAPVVEQAAPVLAVPSVQQVPKIESAPVSAPVVEPAPLTGEEGYHKIVSPMVGTFYSKPEPTAPAFVKAGDKVKAESIVCIVEAMKLFNEIEAEITGEIVKVLVTDGQLVEYGQPLFLVKAE
ncbi:MAG TPA: acetyl-CoA carboxylase biotin carboxyl carrier protein [Bacillota bacterium]|nr:acetyl-CoA carboxylase biotin carboxyl carrier protein [Bacillota bacterium]